MRNNKKDNKVVTPNSDYIRLLESTSLLNLTKVTTSMSSLSTINLSFLNSFQNNLDHVTTAIRALAIDHNYLTINTSLISTLTNFSKVTSTFGSWVKEYNYPTSVLTSALVNLSRINSPLGCLQKDYDYSSISTTLTSTLASFSKITDALENLDIDLLSQSEFLSTNYNSLSMITAAIGSLNIEEDYFNQADLSNKFEISANEVKDYVLAANDKIIELDNNSMILKDKIIAFVNYLKTYFPKFLILYSVIGTTLTIYGHFMIKNTIVNNYNFYNYNDKAIVKEVEKVIVKDEILPNYIIPFYRIVTPGRLNVRLSNSTKSPVIDILNAGDTVKVLCRHKKWTEIQYLNNAGVVVTGYFFNKYLRQIHNNMRY